MLIDLLLLVLKSQMYKFFYEQEIFLVNVEHNLEYVFVVKLPYIIMDFELMKIFHLFGIILNDIFQNNVTKRLYENLFEKYHQRKRKIELILKNK
jgi:hypothetical protein